MSIAQFEIGLANIVGRPSALRPFVCEGSPLECPIFIVGYNPATAVDGDWWRHWKPEYGFMKNVWREEYLRQRSGTLSKTRKQIEAIVSDLEGVNVLECNIDARPSKRKSTFPKPVTAPFDYLLESCRPRIIIAHGVDAVAHLQMWRSQGKLIECKHFIYVGHQRRSEIVAEARSALAVA